MLAAKSLSCDSLLFVSSTSTLGAIGTVSVEVSGGVMVEVGFAFVISPTLSAISEIFSDPAPRFEKSIFESFLSSETAALRPGLLPAFARDSTPCAISFNLEIPSLFILATALLISVSFWREFFNFVNPRCASVVEDSISICKVSIVLSTVYLLPGSNSKLCIGLCRPRCHFCLCFFVSKAFLPFRLFFDLLFGNGIRLRRVRSRLRTFLCKGLKNGRHIAQSFVKVHSL